MKNIFKMIILSMFALFCTGCASVDYTMTINKDDSAKLEYLLKLNDNEFNEEIYVELIDTIVKELEEDSFVVERSKNELKAVKNIDNVMEFDYMNSLIKPNRNSNIIKKEENIFTTNYFFDAKIDLTGYSKTTKELKFDELIKENVEINFYLNLPTTSKNSNSEMNNGQTIVWNLSYGEENIIEASYRLINVEIIVIPVLILIVFILILIFIRKKNETIKF